MLSWIPQEIKNELVEKSTNNESFVTNNQFVKPEKSVSKQIYFGQMPTGYQSVQRHFGWHHSNANFISAAGSKFHCHAN